MRAWPIIFARTRSLDCAVIFALLRAKKLTADLGGPIIMVQVDNEYGLFGTDQAYLRVRADIIGHARINM